MTPLTKAANLEERARALVEDVLAEGPHFVVDFSVRGSAGSLAVDVFVDSDTALGADVLAGISHEVGYALDTEDVIPGRYMLNVSSPGVDKPLRLPRQYRKNIGRALRVHFQREDEGGFTEILGTLVAADTESIRVSLSDTESRCINYADILWAKVQLPW